MNFIPLRATLLQNDALLCVNDTGRHFTASATFVEQLASGNMPVADARRLRDLGHVLAPDDALGWVAHARGVAERLTQAGQLDYLILVPTLRCNLACSYCQVSRVGIDRAGFDWSKETLAAVLDTIGRLPTRRIKIEFQGGEPTLRPDLIRVVMDACARFDERQFVICTNLLDVSEEVIEIFDHPDVFISTSLDGNAALHGRNRTKDKGTTDRFFANLRSVIERYGPRKISALPTIDASSPPDIDDLIDVYVAHGFESIFLRPINFQGFARKRHKASRAQDDGWRNYYERFVRTIIARNWADRDRVLEETYFSIALRRIFQPGRDRHVDLRNPNPMGVDYIVVDHDGVVYPTDEARMLARSGVIDLSIGTIAGGWDGEARALLNQHVTNLDDPACNSCAYQPFCGRDVVDDIARYGRIDQPRYDTQFCRRHLHLFDFVFQLIYDDDPAVRYSLARWLRLAGTPARFGETFA
jgi:His-Xaa-Ser system radical SAM maturase HxsB